MVCNSYEFECDKYRSEISDTLLMYVDIELSPMKLILFLAWISMRGVLAYWDVGTTTGPVTSRWDEWSPRTSRFRWQRSEHHWHKLLFPYWDWHELTFRRRLYVVAGVSYEMLNLGTAAILNRRTLITAANLLDPYMIDPKTVRVWALGRQGKFNTPWRYRVWRLTRVNPRSKNPEHCHGPFCNHQPRHDVCIIHTLDQMYVYHETSLKWHYATRTFLTDSFSNLLLNQLYITGSGYEYLRHIRENYKIFYTEVSIGLIRDCSLYVPKWWGKFICFLNSMRLPAIQNGGPLFNDINLVGLGCFLHTYKSIDYLMFTDLRFYVYWIYNLADIKPGEYYEYAYPHYSVKLGWVVPLVNSVDLHRTKIIIPTKQIRDEMYPLGRK